MIWHQPMAKLPDSRFNSFPTFHRVPDLYIRKRTLYYLPLSYALSPLNGQEADIASHMGQARWWDLSGVYSCKQLLLSTLLLHNNCVIQKSSRSLF